LFKDSLLEGANLVGRQYEEKRLQEDDGLSETSIQVVVVRVDQFPHPGGIWRDFVEKIGGTEAVVCAEILNQLSQNAHFVEKLQAVGEQDEA